MENIKKRHVALCVIIFECRRDIRVLDITLLALISRFNYFSGIDIFTVE